VASSSGPASAEPGLDSTDDLDDAAYARLAAAVTSADAGNDEPPPSSDLSRRLFALLSGLLRIHIQIAANEARRDQARLLRAVFCFVVASFLGLMSLLLCEGLAFWALTQIPLRYPLALAALIGCNLLFAGLLALVGRSALRDPVMPETRALLRRTLRSLFPL
jgi:uncharacterized membrane protein YqjE